MIQDMTFFPGLDGQPLPILPPPALEYRCAGHDERCKRSMHDLTNSLPISLTLDILMLLKGGRKQGGTVRRGKWIEHTNINKTSL